MLAFATEYILQRYFCMFLKCGLGMARTKWHHKAPLFTLEFAYKDKEKIFYLLAANIYSHENRRGFPKGL